MTKRLSVAIAGLTVALVTSGPARAQTATQDVKEKTAAAAQKTGEVLSDAEITAAVKSKLLADKLVGGLKIDVDTDKGVVTLTGPVESAAEKAKAIELARQTHGVKRVVNKLTIEKNTHPTGTSGKKDEGTLKKGEEKTEEAAKKVGDATTDAAKSTGRFLSDAEITSAVKTKLIGDSGVHAMDINVDTDKGVVTLQGTVRSEPERAAAVKIAKDTMGVKRVVDKLTVK